MSVLRSVETAAETVAVLSETVAEAAGAVDDVVESGRSLLKLLILALIGLAVVAAVVKMVKGHGQAPAAELDQSVEAGGSEEIEGV